MKTLGAQFADLVQSGAIQLGAEESHFENGHDQRRYVLKTVYSVGEALVRQERDNYAELESGFNRNSNRRFKASQ